MLWRTLWHKYFVGSRGPKIAFAAVSASRFRVWPTDLDLLGHMNNGKYLSVLDVARFDLILRNGIYAVFQREKWYPVVVGQTISYRKSLNPWRKFTVESRILGFDEQAVYLEQRFVRGAKSAEVYARAYIRARVLSRQGGVVKIAQLCEKVGVDPADFTLPEQVLAWGLATRLPSTRQAAPSIWE